MRETAARLAQVQAQVGATRAKDRAFRKAYATAMANIHSIAQGLVCLQTRGSGGHEVLGGASVSPQAAMSGVTEERGRDEAL